MNMPPTDTKIFDENTKYGILEAIHNNGGKISRNKLHEVTNITYKDIDKIITDLIEDDDIKFFGGKFGKLKNKRKWKMVEITRKGEIKLGI
jgi:predicted transcriptional regulator